MPSLRAGVPWQQGNHRVSSFVPLLNHIPDKTAHMEFLQYIVPEYMLFANQAKKHF